MATKRRLGAALLGLAASALFLALALRKVDLGQAWQTLRGLDPSLLLWPLLIGMINMPLRAWRWQAIFPSPSRPRFWTSFQVLAMSLTLNNFLPGRGGDVARCVLVNRRVTATDSTIALATLGVEKLLDALALLLVVLYACWILTPPAWLRELGIAAALLVGGTTLLLIALRYRAAWLLDLLSRGAARLRLERAGNALAMLLQSFSDGLAAIASPSQLLLLLLQTAAIWASEAALFFVFARVVGASLSLSGCVVSSAILGLGLMIPAAPAAVGTYEFFSTAALKLVGMAAPAALAMTVLLHAWVLLWSTALGLGSMATAGFRVRQLQETTGASAAAAPGA